MIKQECEDGRPCGYGGREDPEIMESGRINTYYTP